MPSIQSIVFPKSRHSLRDAVEWLRRRGFKTDVDEKPYEYRFRQEDPDKFKRFITTKTNDHVDIVMGI